VCFTRALHWPRNLPIAFARLICDVPRSRRRDSRFHPSVWLLPAPHAIQEVLEPVVSAAWPDRSLSCTVRAKNGTTSVETPDERGNRKLNQPKNFLTFYALVAILLFGQERRFFPSAAASLPLFLFQVPQIRDEFAWFPFSMDSFCIARRKRRPS